MAEPGFPCAACGCKVHTLPAGCGARCPVCGWFDDFEQLVHPDLTYGANAGRTLRQAQADALRAGTVGSQAQDSRWRPLGPDETPAADPHGLSSPICYIATPDPEDYQPYWLRRD
jgi:hypothetical protein